MADIIHTTIERWHRIVATRDPGGLDDLLADDVVFVSPIIHRPQEGKALTSMYLQGALQVLGTDDFRYTKQVLDGTHAVLEFETKLGDTLVNGVDIISCDDDGRIVEFRVMLRPLRAVNEVHAAMGALLATIEAPD